MEEKLELTLSHLPRDMSWGLVQWLLDRGADEFTLACVSGRSEDAFFCRQVDQALSPYVVPSEPNTAELRKPSAGDRPRWRFNRRSLGVLKTFLPDGVLTDRQGSSGGWLEDLTIYQGGQPRLASNTHEHGATLTLTDSEYQELRELRLVE